MLAKDEIKPWVRKFISDPIILFTIFTVLLAIPRFYWQLSNQYNYITLLFVVMWVIPFAFINKNGRKTIGIRKPNKPLWLFYGLALGITASVAVYWIGLQLFGRTENNWYVTIMNSFNKDNIINEIKPYFWVFLMVTLPIMVFSPIGEEFFFRGIINSSYETKVGYSKAVFIDALFFGTTHLAHHGLVATDSRIQILPSALLWLILMMLVSALLSYIRKKSGSIWGAVLCHAGFNLGMMACIVYLLHE